MTTNDFDPELYLRLLGERALAADEDLGKRHGGQAAMPEAAAALAVNGVISPELADEITSEYSLASLVRQESPMLGHHLAARARAPEEAGAAEPVHAPRTYALDRTLSVPGGRLQLGVLTAAADGGRFQAVFVPDSELGGGQSAPPTFSVRLPTGQSTRTTFGGGWGGHQVQGHFSFDGDLSGVVPWLEIEGHRLELPAPAPPGSVQIETLGPERRAIRYLWQLVGDFNGPSNHSGLTNRAASDALVRAGLIAVDDPELEALLWVADAVGGGHARRMPRRMRQRHPRAAPANAPAAVPPGWRSVLQSPVTGPGPEGVLALGVATPVFDGLSVALTGLRSERDSATLEVTATHTLFGSATGPVVWWAHDDRGNHYHGESGSWGGLGGDEGIASGEIVFGPLHTTARTLTVAITRLDARALIPVALDWPDREPTP